MTFGALCRYKATVEAVTPGGYFVVYDEWGNKEEVCGFSVL